MDWSGATRPAKPPVDNTMWVFPGMILSQMVDHLDEAIYAFNRTGNITFVSGGIERFSGYRPQEVLGHHYTEFVHSEDVGEVAAAVDRVFLGQAEQFEFRGIARDGGVRYLSTQARPLCLGDQVVGLSAALRDVTDLHRAEEERRQLQERLAQAQRLETLGRLVGGVAHDFNNLLFVILNQIDMIRCRKPAGPAFEQSIREIEQAAVLAAALARQLLSCARNRGEANEAIRIDQYLRENTDLTRRIMGEDIAIELRLNPVEPIEFDRGKLGQLILNLIANARDAMPRGGRLGIETALVVLGPEAAAERCLSPGSYAVLTIDDTGLGMAPEVQARAFEPFFTTKAGHQNAGLGLATVFTIVQDAGGQVRIDSAPGRGTTIQIYLPVLERRFAEPGKPAAPASQLEGKTVLLCEDDLAVRELLVSMLQSFGAEVLVAPGAREALVLAERRPGPIDLLVTDVVMPGSSGIELAKELLHQRPRTRIMYMSGYNREALARRGIIGKGCLLQKPFRSEELLSKIAEALAGEV